MLREARGSLKATVGKRVKPDYRFIHIVFVIFCFFQPDSCVPLQCYAQNNKKRSHTQLDSRKQVIAFQDRVITINIKEAQHPLK